MKHKQYKEWLELLLYDELSEKEVKLLNEHLSSCKECRDELEKLQKLHKILTNYQLAQVKEEFLENARRDLRMKIQEESLQKTLWRNLTDALDNIITPKVRIAVSGVAVLVVGVFIGYFVFGLANRDSSGISFFADETKVSNFRFFKKDVQTGNVEFKFDAIVPVHIRGNVEDENVQKILAQALVSEENIGTRLSAVSMLGIKTEGTYKDNTELENEIKSALIIVLLKDENLGVRREALNALKQYLPDPEVTRAFLTIIKNEKNVSLRISAIKSLDVYEYKNRPLSGEMIELLKQTAQSDENNYVRILAKSTLKEIEQ